MIVYEIFWVLIRLYYMKNIIYHLILLTYYHLIKVSEIFRGNGTGGLHKFAIAVDPGFNYSEIFSGAIHCCIMESKKLFQKSILHKRRNFRTSTFQWTIHCFQVIKKEFFDHKKRSQTLKISRLRFKQSKPKTKVEISSFSLPPILQTFKQNLSSEKGFIAYK